MYPPSSSMNLDIDAISGILGSVSIACWIVVFSPQIIENFRRGSADGLSVVFIVIWSAGDIFNVLGGVLQGVLPTMLILAVYYCFVDIFLIGQCFYYRGFTLTDKIPDKKPANGDAENNSSSNEATPLLAESNGTSTPVREERRPSLERIFSVDGTHLSPATPLLKSSGAPPPPPPVRTYLQTFLFNSSAVVIVCAAGVLGWYLSARHSPSSPNNDKSPTDALHLNILGQVFGYICAALYLGSRIPQLLLNYRRKGTEGISMLFFLFACIGNLTYVLSIFAYAPDKACRHGPKHCRSGEAAGIYGRYILVNFSWLLGSFGTLFLDLGVFVQHFMYMSDEEERCEETATTASATDAHEAHISGSRARRTVSFTDER